MEWNEKEELKDLLAANKRKPVIHEKRKKKEVKCNSSLNQKDRAKLSNRNWTIEKVKYNKSNLIGTHKTEFIIVIHIF